MIIHSQAIAKAEKICPKEMQSIDKANIAAMREAQKALVSIVDLKAAIAESEKYNAENYTADSYKVLQDAVAAAEALKADGTKRICCERSRSDSCSNKRFGKTCFRNG